MPYEFGDIVLVSFPFTDLTTTKRRPAVVVSSAAYNGSKADVVILAITGQIRQTLGLGELWINQWQASGLLKPSVIKPVFATVEQALLVRTLGKLLSEDSLALRLAIGDVFGLTPP